MSHGHTPLFILPLEQGGEGAPEQEEHCGESVFFFFLSESGYSKCNAFSFGGQKFQRKAADCASMCCANFVSLKRCGSLLLLSTLYIDSNSLSSSFILCFCC
jgi:hypothetical protein